MHGWVSNFYSVQLLLKFVYMCFIHTEELSGWDRRDSSAVESITCCYRGPQFDSQHALGNSPWSVPPVPGIQPL